MLGCRPPHLLGFEVQILVFDRDCKSFTKFSRGGLFKIEALSLFCFNCLRQLVVVSLVYRDPVPWSILAE
jgi:hypothetical protein